MKCAVIILILIPLCYCPAQNKDSLDVQNLFGDIIEESTEDSEDYGLLELLEQLRNNPVNINKAGIDELMRIPFITPLIAKNIISYRKRNGNFAASDSLIKIAGIDSQKLREILPFITTAENTGLDFLGSEIFFRSRTQNDLQLRRGFRENIYLGSKMKFYNRLMISNSGYFRAGVLAEKDAGENSISDFTSFHLQISPGGIIRQVNIGDFAAEFGNGLVIRSPYRISKSAFPSSIKSRDITAYTGSDENRFLRGIALKTGLDNFSLTGFYSQNKIDASIDPLSGIISAFPADGYHRTDPELIKKDMCTERSAGIITGFGFSENYSVSFLYYRASFSPGVNSQSQPGMSGSSFSYLSSYFRIVFGNIFLCGEFAYDLTSVASINTIEIDFDKNLSLTASVRNYPRNYFGIRASAFGESGKAGNETGIYFGMEYKSPAGVFNIYYDVYKFPAPAYSVSFPSQGKEFQLNYSLRPAPRSEIRIRYKYENKEEEIIAGAFREMRFVPEQKLRFEFIYSPSRMIDLKSRLELTEAPASEAGGNEHGFLIFQDIRYKPVESLQLLARLIFFSTDGYSSRIYEFENDLAGVMANPALYGTGMRWYAVIRFSPNRIMDLTVKYSESLKPGERCTGCGYNEIQGNLDNRVSLQLDLNL